MDDLVSFISTEAEEKEDHSPTLNLTTSSIYYFESIINTIKIILILLKDFLTIFHKF